MSEMILPSVYINVHAEALIAPPQITISNLGVVGTAAKGPLNTPILLGSFADARKEFYDYDAWLDASLQPNSNALTLVRALEQAFAFGATTVYAVRVGNTKSPPTSAALTLRTAGPDTLVLTANQPGTWGNHLSVDVQLLAGQHAFINEEVVSLTGPGALTLKRPIDISNARNRVTVELQGVSRSLQVVNRPPKLGAGEVQVIPGTGKLVFLPPELPKAPATVTASYMTLSNAQQVTLHLDNATEVYVVADLADLAGQILNQSSWATAPADTTATKQLLPVLVNPPVYFKSGTDGAEVDPKTVGSVYGPGLDALLNVDAHIIVAAGQDNASIGAQLEQHCALASTDSLKRDRIAVVGSRLIDPGQPDNPRQDQIDKFFDEILGHNLSSDRVIFVAAGMQAPDSALGQQVTLPGAYSAAAVAGLIASFDPEVSLTNKPLAVSELEVHFDAAHLTQMVLNRILALEARSGFRIVKGITTDDGAFRQITTRRIVDYAKYGIRASAEPYIGLLNDERVRGALRGTLNSFLTDMVNAEMLESYDLDVSATRDEEIQGICRVTISMQPVFSIDFIVVDLFLG